MGCSSGKAKIKKGKDKLTIGYYHESLHEADTRFDDWQSMKLKGQSFQKIYAIKVQFNDQIIIGVELAYQLENGSIITGGPHFVQEYDPEKMKEEVFEIQCDDFLSEISGRVGLNLYQICFKTYKGTHQTFGTSVNGKQFSFKIEGLTFGPFAGIFGSNDSGNVINQLEIPLVPAPDSFLVTLKQDNQLQAINQAQLHQRSLKV